MLSKNYCELAGRNEPVIADIILSFVEMGIDFNKLEEKYQQMKSKKLPILPQLQPQQPPKQIAMLQAGTKQPLPNHIPQHLPMFPDPHAYVRTPVNWVVLCIRQPSHNKGSKTTFLFYNYSATSYKIPP